MAPSKHRKEHTHSAQKEDKVCLGEWVTRGRESGVCGRGNRAREVTGRSPWRSAQER